METWSDKLFAALGRLVGVAWAKRIVTRCDIVLDEHF